MSEPNICNGGKSWVIVGSLEQRMDFHRLWWTVIVFQNCYLFYWFDFFCLIVQYLLLFENLLFLFLIFDNY